ncbi:PEP-CTERM sorting domain-containing protein [Thiobacillus sp.]|uniref:PEP-CTERM sorting domain-containing protein n=1 Tax=Thiobacillus sp. TaxID=924 RepID=UPI0017E27558|nr:PEP-CTERM sorting domain-containing protein [Thiobacillus sp.]MBC2732195.1 PEP-CTERM sorting domain-containing protein [Thiobacillus sp.]MBC2740933.1 PEP-CTERM sorting domain-containing protein [Thiobacillus sp.]MBC2759982.1 PEP-CTERM sorting domain-containing protein [Thiobacillus sp.]
MTFTKTLFALAIGSVGIMGSMSAHAVANTFSFNGGTVAGGVPTGGSWFSMLATDTNSDGIADTNVYTAMRAAGTTGTDLSPGTLNFDVAEPITVGAPGGHNSGNSIDRDWSFFNAWGAHFTDQALEVTWDGVSNTATVHMAGWQVAWNGGVIDMGAGADAIINLGGDGLGGNNDTLDYSAIVPSGGFAGVQYGLHLQGNATLAVPAPIPEASTYGMMLAGLGLVGFAVRRRKQAI